MCCIQAINFKPSTCKVLGFLFFKMIAFLYEKVKKTVSILPVNRSPQAFQYIRLRFARSASRRSQSHALALN